VAEAQSPPGSIQNLSIPNSAFEHFSYGFQSSDFILGPIGLIEIRK
jgi:hypothetical protein